MRKSGCRKCKKCGTWAMFADHEGATNCPECGAAYERQVGILRHVIQFFRKQPLSKTVVILNSEFERVHIPNVARMFDRNPESAKKTISARAFLHHNGDVASTVQALESDLR